MIPTEAHVECYSGSEYAEQPRAFTWEGQRLEVVEVLQRWRTPSGKSFRVVATDGQVYDLFYEELSRLWQFSLA